MAAVNLHRSERRASSQSFRRVVRGSSAAGGGENGGDAGSLSTRVTTVGHLRFLGFIIRPERSDHTWTALSAPVTPCDRISLPRSACK